MPSQDTQRPDTLRIHLQNLDFRTRSIHLKSDPPNAGTEHLAYFEENRVSSYQDSWEAKAWFEDITKDKEVVIAMVISSEAQCLQWSTIHNYVQKR